MASWDRRITDEDIERFYLKLLEAVEEWPGFGKLPPRKRGGPDRSQRLFHLAYVRHYVNPEHDQLPPEDSENWLMIYDDRISWKVSFPEALCPEGLTTTERVTARLDDAALRFNGYRKRYEAIYGKFQIKRRDGAVYLRHIGPIDREKPLMDVYE